MPSPFTGSAEEKKRMKQHSSPKAFEFYLKEVERISNEAARPSPTPMASSPTALPATTRLDDGSDSPVTTRQQLFVDSTNRQPTNNTQPINPINQSNQSIQSINPINPINQSNQSNQPINSAIHPTHPSILPPTQSQHSATEQAAQAVMQREMADMRALINAMKNDIEGLECALSEKEQGAACLEATICELRSAAISQAEEVGTLQAQLLTATSASGAASSASCALATGSWKPISISGNCAISVIDELIQSYTIP